LGWKVNFAPGDDGGEKSVNLDDLSPDTFAEIAKEVDAGLTYWGVYAFPRETPEILYRVICAAAKHAQIDAPAKATNMREQRLLDGMLEQVDDIADQPHGDGLPLVPDGTESGSSTTSSDDTSGDLQTSDESLSEIS
jgi:hypothetical protein